MSWFKKAIKLLKRYAPEEVKEAIDIGKQVVEGTVGFAKLSTEMAHAALVNVEEGLAKGYRAVTGTGGMPDFDSQEGPLQSNVSIQDLVSMSESSYSDDGGAREGYTTVSKRDVKDLSFTVYQNKEDGHVVVSFRGTNSFKNWQKRNLDFHKRDDGHGNMVHGGFKSAWDELKPAVDEELFGLFGGSTVTNNLTFTGHSLGGAIAQLATADYTSVQDPRLIDGVTFASPVVGDEGFNKRVPGGHLMNVIDPRDSVPKIVQELQPDFKENTLAHREMSLGDRAARVNDRVKKDAIRFGIELSFDVGIGLMLAYAPEVLKGAEELGPEVDAEIIEGGLALEEELIAVGEKAAGVGIEAEEAETIKLIGGAEAEGITTAERADISILLNAENRAAIVEQLKAIDVRSLVENTVRNAVGDVDWNATITKAMIGAGVSKSVQNLITPFVMENAEGLEEVEPEKISFLLQNGWDYMYGSVVAHPVGTYIKNVRTRFGDKDANARDMMWKNYQLKLEQEGLSDDALEFMTEEELKEFQDSFAHDFIEDEDEDAEDDAGDADDVETEDEEQDEEDETGAEFSLTTVGAGREERINGQPLRVVSESTGRKANGERIFAVETEEGAVLAYTGPSHPSSTTTLYGKWTGVAPFANALPVKVNRRNAFGDEAYSALDTFSMAYLVNSYTDGYHNKEADEKYMKRIRAAIDNGFIGESVDPDEFRVARMILQEFEENGHLFGAGEESMLEKGNMLSEIKSLSRGALADIGDDVNGLRPELTSGTKRKMDRALGSNTGRGVAGDVISRDRKRMRSSDVDSSHILEEGMSTMDFNLRAMRILGLDKTPEYDVIMNGAKQASFGYKTALNVEEMIANTVKSRMNKGGLLEHGILPNVLGQYTTRDINLDDERGLGGDEEYLKDMATLEILKTLL